MSPIGHFSYSNPTVQEAICEIVFALEEGTSWNPLWFGEFFKQVQTEFSSFQPVSLMGLQIGFGNAPQTNIPLPSQVVRYIHPSRPALLQLSDRSLVITSLAVYPGWDVVSKDIEYALDKLKAVVNPAKVLRIGLRYINRIERSASNETLGAWFVSTDYIPKGILNSLPGFISLVQMRIDKLNRLNVTIGEQEATPSAETAFILDIDRTMEGELPLDTARVLEETVRLHNDIWEVFNSAKTDKLERLLNGELV